jgi:hypothetical protein
LEGYAISPDTIYTKKKYTFTGINEKRGGKITTDMVVIPKNFIKDFNFYFLVVSGKVMNVLQDRHLTNEVCRSRQRDSSETHLDFESNREDVLLKKEYKGNPHQNILIKEDYKVTKNGEFFAIFCVCPDRSEIPPKSVVTVRTYKVDKSKNYIEFSGQMSFKNPHGYLNGDQLLNMRYYFFMSLIYVAFAFYWVWKIWQRKEYLIFFHYII